MLSTIRKDAGIFLLIIVVAAVDIRADDSHKMNATLVGIFPWKRCSDKACPPWPLPNQNDFCFQAESDYFVGTTGPWDIHSAGNAQKLMMALGKQVPIVVGKRYISVEGSDFRLRLKRISGEPSFGITGCLSADPIQPMDGDGN